MGMEKAGLEVLADQIQQDILDGINSHDAMCNVVNNLIGEVNEVVNRHESTIMSIDSALEKAEKEGQYDAMDYLTLAKQIVSSTDKDMIDALKEFQKVLNELDKTNDALHRIEEVVVEHLSNL